MWNQNILNHGKGRDSQFCFCLVLALSVVLFNMPINKLDTDIAMCKDIRQKKDNVAIGNMK